MHLSPSNLQIVDDSVSAGNGVDGREAKLLLIKGVDRAAERDVVALEFDEDFVRQIAPGEKLANLFCDGVAKSLWHFSNPFLVAPFVCKYRAKSAFEDIDRFSQ